MNSEAHSATADNNLSADATIALTSGYGGRGYNTTWMQDPDVGIVVECAKVTSLPCTQFSCDVQSSVYGMQQWSARIV